jgi:hypothetical protein
LLFPVPTMPDGDTPGARVESRQSPLPAVRCPECQLSFTADSLDTHLRRAHRIYQFRGVRRTLNDTLTALTAATVRSRPDPEAWRSLAAIAREEHGSGADLFLAATLGRAVSLIKEEKRPTVIDALAGVLAPGASAQLAAALASDAELAVRHLALALLGRMAPPLDPVLHPPLRGLLLDRRLPVDGQLDAVATLLRGVGCDSVLGAEFLEKLVTGLGKARSIERYRQLEQRLGKTRAIDALCAHLEDQLRMSCPRCGVELRRPQMIEHLWREHQVLLDGRRVREPWPLIEDWLDAYCSRHDPELLQRCRTLGQRLDPEQGLLRVHRLLLARGVPDAEARNDLLEDAREQHAARCSWCYALVPVPREVPPHVLLERPGRLSACGYSVELSEAGLFSRLEVRTPGKVIRRGRDPDHPCTPRGALVFFAGPLVLLALGWAFAGPQPLFAVLAVLVVALIVDALIRIRVAGRRPLEERLLDHAWRWLAPHLHEREFVLEDSAFLAGLAQRSEEAGDPAWRAPLLPGLLKRTENAIVNGEGPPNHLAALRRLAVADAARAGVDPVPVVVEQLARCFQGRLPLAFAEHLLDDWQSEWWTRGNLARLRILLCDRAFEAGFEVGNLLDAGQNAPALGTVLGTDEVQGLAALRLLWSLRPSKPWDRCGPVLTAFELAADPKYAPLLGRHPDLLLWQEEPDWPEVADAQDDTLSTMRILLCVRGVFLQETLLTAVPREVALRMRFLGSELVVDEHHFRSPGPLDNLATRIERWCRYAFNEFLPQAVKVQTWQSPDRAAILRAWGAVSCPECRRYLLARVGEVGIALDEAAPVRDGER